MTTRSPIGWFEIARPDPAKTDAFYATLFGWTFSDGSSGPDYRMADTEGPMAGGITKAPPGAPESYASFGVIVDDIGEASNRTCSTRQAHPAPLTTTVREHLRYQTRDALRERCPSMDLTATA